MEELAQVRSKDKFNISSLSSTLKGHAAQLKLAAECNTISVKGTAQCDLITKDAIKASKKDKKKIAAAKKQGVVCHNSVAAALKKCKSKKAGASGLVMGFAALAITASLF